MRPSRIVGPARGARAFGALVRIPFSPSLLARPHRDRSVAATYPARSPTRFRRANLRCDGEPLYPAVAVRGTVGDGGVEFKGISYAAPPVGDLRWEPPQEPADWTEVLDATRFRSACPQEARYGLTEASSD